MMILDKMQPSDWDAVRQIYEEGIAAGNATFQREVPGWKNGITATCSIAE